MNKLEFETFLTIKEKSKPLIDWAKRKSDWLQRLAELHEKFRRILAKYTKNGRMTISCEDIEIIEESIGRYRAPQMTIAIADDRVVLRPVGTNLIAARGRVDVRGPYGEAQLVLVDANSKRPGDHIRITLCIAGETSAAEEQPTEEKGDWVWRFVTGPPDRQYLPVMSETVFSMIADLTDGK